jgi:hypothetical protein
MGERVFLVVAIGLGIVVPMLVLLYALWRLMN